MFSLLENISFDVNYQYVNLGEFESGTEVIMNEVRRTDLDPPKGLDGKFKPHELMVGLRYRFN